jgi:hypothetical protein
MRTLARKPNEYPPQADFNLRRLRTSSSAISHEAPEVRRRQRTLDNQNVAPPMVHDVLRSLGRPLDGATRSFFEPRFGHDFSRVRVHAEGQAPDSAHSLNALAFTVGSNVVFAAGQYRPQSLTGQKLLAHELAHVVQQSKEVTHTGASEPLTMVPATDPSEREADRIADAVLHTETNASVVGGGVAPGGLQRGLALQRQPNPTLGTQGTTTGTQGTTQGTQATTQATPCATLLAATTSEAVRQIQQANKSLNLFAAEQVYPLDRKDPGTPEHQRVAAHLQATFNTTDAIDVEAISFRLARLERALSGGEVQMSCGTGCGGGAGGNVLEGYSPGPFHFTLCATNASPPRLATTMIHECAHAVLPAVGVKEKPTAGSRTGVIDRAYRQERLFTYLSPMEAMTNAESYSELVDGLISNKQPGMAAGASDKVQRCSDPGSVKAALGRAQVAARLLVNWLEGAVGMLVQSGSTDVSQISDPFGADLQAAFPGVTTLAQLRQIKNDATIIFNNFSNPELIQCASAASRCPTGRLGFVNDIAITASALVRVSSILDRSGAMNLCSGWSSASEDDRVATMYALVATSYLGGAAIQTLRPTDALKLARFALLVVGRYLPAPVARSSTEHLLH